MKKTFKLILFIAGSLLLVCIFSLLYSTLKDQGTNEEIVQYAVYQGSDEYLIMGYSKKSEKIQFQKYTNDNTYAYETSWATLNDQQEAILDGKQMFPIKEGLFYKFIFIDRGIDGQYVEFYNNEKLVETYKLILVI